MLENKCISKVLDFEVVITEQIVMNRVAMIHLKILMKDFNVVLFLWLLISHDFIKWFWIIYKIR